MRKKTRKQAFNRLQIYRIRASPPAWQKQRFARWPCYPFQTVLPGFSAFLPNPTPPSAWTHSALSQAASHLMASHILSSLPGVPYLQCPKYSFSSIRSMPKCYLPCEEFLTILGTDLKDYPFVTHDTWHISLIILCFYCVIIMCMSGFQPKWNLFGGRNYVFSPSLHTYYQNNVC